MVRPDSSHGSPLWSTGTWRWFPTPDRRVLLLSVIVQLTLGLLLGHANDMRIFMGTGYLVGTGRNPYVPIDLSAAFHHVDFTLRRTVGYPPPWPLALGFIYRGTYALVPSFLGFNLAIKLPVIAANIGLAYLVAAILKNLGATQEAARKAWIFLLFNPLLIYFGPAWGQIDAIVALLALAALVLLYQQRCDGSAVLLALAVCVKPVAAPLLLAAVVFLAGRSLLRAARYAAVFVAGVLLFYWAPFFVLGWHLTPATRFWNSTFVMSGTMSYMTLLRFWRDPFLLPGRWWLVGLAWIPALAAAAAAMILADRRRARRDRLRDDSRGAHGFDDLLQKSTALVLIFLLTRTWLSESNVVMILPLVLILSLRGEIDRRALAVVWILPLVFTVFGWTPLQLLWVAFPGAMKSALSATAHYRLLSLVVRAALVVAWQAAGWWIVVGCLRWSSAAARGAERRIDRPQSALELP